MRISPLPKRNKRLRPSNVNSSSGDQRAAPWFQSVVLFAAWACLAATASAEIIAFNAESGTLGGSLNTLSDAAAIDGSYIDGPTAGADFPASSGHVASYTVNLDAGTYDLYGRILVPSSSPDSQDSFFIGNGFGTQPFNEASWLQVNRLSATQNSYLDPEGVEIENGVYNWLRFSDQVSFFENIPQFVSTGGAQTFQIGSREAGLRLDAFAFVTSGQSVSSSALSGAVGVPEPGSLALTMFGSLAIGTFRVRRKRQAEETTDAAAPV